jgi:catalase
MTQQHRIIPVSLGLALFAAVMPTQAGPAYDAPGKAFAVDFIEIFEKLSGQHPGIRKGHARGVCAVGHFKPDPAVASRFTSPLLQPTADPVPVTLRFSMGGGNPDADERARAPRGIGVRFELPNGEAHQLAGLTTPVFAGKNPEQFLGLLRINHEIAQGSASSEDRQRYLENNPAAARQGQWLQAHNPAAGYTTATYYGIHSFHAARGKADAVTFRWQLVPDAGEKWLSQEELTTLPRHFLEERLHQRLREDTELTFTWQWVLADEGDDVLDPSIQWPAGRETVNVGTLAVTAAGGDACLPVNFDPNRLASGITPSADPVLALRSAAYAISFGKRLSGQ